MSRSELSRLKIYLHGGVEIDVPVWALLLEMSGGDPLRASVIEEQLTEEWWERWKAWRIESAKAAKEQAK